MISNHQDLIKRVRYYSRLFLCAYFLNPAAGLAQPDSAFSPEIDQSYNFLIRLKIDSAMERLPPLGQPTDPDYPAILYIQNLGDVIELLISEDPVLYDNTSHEEKLSNYNIWSNGQW